MNSPSKVRFLYRPRNHQLPISSIKGEVKKKHISFGWNFSCFSAHLIERDLF
jgi:hypothetical protein